MIHKRNVRTMLLVALSATLIGQLSIRPFDSVFRLSLGVAVLTFLILRFHYISIFRTAVVTACLVLLFRSFLDYLALYPETPITTIVAQHIPSAIFYVIFGLILQHLRVRQYTNKPLLFIFIVAVSDIGANVLETAIRYELRMVTAEIVLSKLFLTGILRTLLSLLLYSSMRFYDVLVVRKEQQKHYHDLLLFTASIKAELVFLKKCMLDIEDAMRRSYSVYSELGGKTTLDTDYIKKLRTKLLRIAKDIHEVKKNNQRVLAGIEHLLPIKIEYASMPLFDILDLLHDNTIRYITSLNKKIELSTNYRNNLSITEYYPLITVLNNLLNNAIESISSEGEISVTQIVNDNFLIIEVSDTGCGIKQEDLDIIFNPGFSTKFDKITGEMSSGIGLTYVKHIVETTFDGKIYVHSQTGGGSKFALHLRLNKL